MSDQWSTSRLSHRPSKPAYYIVDCRIQDVFDFIHLSDLAQPMQLRDFSAFIIIKEAFFLKIAAISSADI